MSDVGMEAVLLQNEKPVLYASRVCNDYEKNYAPVDEMRADVFGLHKFSDNCYRRHVTIVKPQNIRSNQQQASKQSTKKTVKNNAFDTEFWLQNKGSDVIIADVLSRAPVEDVKFQFPFSDLNLLEFLSVSEQTREHHQRRLESAEAHKTD